MLGIQESPGTHQPDHGANATGTEHAFKNMGQFNASSTVVLFFSDAVCWGTYASIPPRFLPFNCNFMPFARASNLAKKQEIMLDLQLVEQDVDSSWLEANT